MSAHQKILKWVNQASKGGEKGKEQKQAPQTQPRSPFRSWGERRNQVVAGTLCSPKHSYWSHQYILWQNPVIRVEMTYRGVTAVS